MYTKIHAHNLYRTENWKSTVQIAFVNCRVWSNTILDVQFLEGKLRGVYIHLSLFTFLALRYRRICLDFRRGKEVKK